MNFSIRQQQETQTLQGKQPVKPPPLKTIRLTNGFPATIMFIDLPKQGPKR